MLLEKEKRNAEYCKLDEITLALRNPQNFVRTVMVTDNSYIDFAYTEKQINDVRSFCSKLSNYSVYGIHTAYNLCDMWITDTSYRNKRLLNSSSGKHSVFLGSVIIHFTKDENTFLRFALEILASNSNCMESVIQHGFKKVIPSISRLVCVQHLKARDESKLSKLLRKTGRSSTVKQHTLSNILKELLKIFMTQAMVICTNKESSLKA